MLRRITVALAVAAAWGAGAPAQSLSVTSVSNHQEAKPELRHGCEKLYSQRQFTKYGSKVYHREEVTYKARRQMVTMIRCQHSPKAERKMRKARKAFRAQREQRQALAALTPYGPCYGGRWAVPCGVIGCESHGSWTVVNEIGALGPYQFKGWAVPWPVRTLADKIRHHLQAAKLWAQSHSHWQQCL